MKKTAWRLSSDTEAQLEGLVDAIESKPGSLPNPEEIEEGCQTIDLKEAVETLPNALDEEELVAILRLAMLTECATDSYAAVFDESARMYDAPWLGRFNQNVWVPDEHTHQFPFLEFLKRLGFSEEELVRQIRQTQQEPYDHCCGMTPVELTTFGMIQEYLTDHWHGLIARLLRPSSRLAAHFANLIKKRETLHMMWYRDMTALQMRGNPELLSLIASAVVNFRMPGHSFQLTRSIQERAPELLPKMGADMLRVWQQFILLFHQTLGYDRHRSGHFLLELGMHKSRRFALLLAPLASLRPVQEFAYDTASVGAGMKPSPHSAPYEKTIGRIRLMLARKLTPSALLA